MFAVKTEQIIKITLSITGIAIGLFLFPFLIKVFAPFVAAFIVAAPCQRIVVFLEKRLKLSRGISSAIISTLIVAAGTGIVLALSFQLFSQTRNLITTLPAAIDSFKGQLSGIIDKFNGFKLSLAPEVSAFIDKITANFRAYSEQLSQKVTDIALSAAGSFASTLPNLVLFLVMFILGTFFFTKDYNLIINFLKEVFPEKIVQRLNSARAFLTRAFSSYLKAQLILMGITSALITVSLWVIGKEYALLWGLVCGLVDVLPFLGTAVILLPWALASLAYGDIYTFVSLLIIQALVFVVRQVAEPKVVSQQIGIHPILTLISVYVGLRFFGVAGMIFAPVFTLVLVNFYVSYKEHSGA